MTLRTKIKLNAFDEDAFLWGEGDEDVAGLSPTEAERVGLHLFEAVCLPASLLLEDPNERLAKHINNEAMFAALQKGDQSRQIHSEDIANNFYELEPQGGRVAFEANPADAPALARVVIEHGRWSLVLFKLLTIFREIGSITAKELEPLGMTEPLDAAHMGNRYFRLVTESNPPCQHDVACLAAWVEPARAPKRVELLAWPIEKL